MYSVLSRIYHDDVHTAWFSNHLTKALPCSFLWRHHRLTYSRSRSCSRTTLSPRLAQPEFSLSSLPGTHQTKPQVSGGATPSCFSGAATPMLALVLFFMLQLDLDSGHPSIHQRQVSLIAGLPSCFEWCFSPSLFRCRDSKPWTGGVIVQAHHGHQDLPRLRGAVLFSCMPRLPPRHQDSP